MCDATSKLSTFAAMEFKMEDLVDQIVVVDVEALFVYIGTLSAVNDKSVTLQDVDVHDLRDSKTTRERYVLDSRSHGVRTNRKRVFIQRQQVVSISALDDVIE